MLEDAPDTAADGTAADVDRAGVLGGGYARDADSVARRHLFMFEAFAAIFG